ncbi:MAG: DUF397 domain-containing protein [Pseudonocardia sp.]
MPEVTVRTWERPDAWRKSSYSNQANGCVEMRVVADGHVEIRDTKLTHSPVISFTSDQWARWLGEVIADKLTNRNGAVDVSVSVGAWTVRSSTTAENLVFNTEEWRAFRLGAINGEFGPMTTQVDRPTDDLARSG